VWAEHCKCHAALRRRLCTLSPAGSSYTRRPLTRLRPTSPSASRQSYRARTCVVRQDPTLFPRYDPTLRGAPIQQKPSAEAASARCRTSQPNAATKTTYRDSAHTAMIPPSTRPTHVAPTPMSGTDALVSCFRRPGQWHLYFHPAQHLLCHLLQQLARLPHHLDLAFLVVRLQALSLEPSSVQRSFLQLSFCFACSRVNENIARPAASSTRLRQHDNQKRRLQWLMEVTAMLLQRSFQARVCNACQLWRGQPLLALVATEQVAVPYQHMEVHLLVLTTLRKRSAITSPGLYQDATARYQVTPCLVRAQILRTQVPTMDATSLVRMVSLLANLSSYSSSKTTTRKTTSTRTIQSQRSGLMSHVLVMSSSLSAETCSRLSASGTMAGQRVSGSPKLLSNGKHGKQTNGTRA
jgi:hypothetical protein